MKAENHPTFNDHDVIHELKHYLPAQSPLKDFIHHNTLHAFQKLNFHTAANHASEILGYRVSLSLTEFRQLYAEKKIREDILEMVIRERKGANSVKEWKEKAIHGVYGSLPLPRIGQLRSIGKENTSSTSILSFSPSCSESSAVISTRE